MKAEAKTVETVKNQDLGEKKNDPPAATEGEEETSGRVAISARALHHRMKADALPTIPV